MVKVNDTNKILEIKIKPSDYQLFIYDKISFLKENFPNIPIPKEIIISKKSLDARKKDIFYNLRLILQYQIDKNHPPTINIPKVQDRAPHIHIVGFGPAGIFAAIKCLQLGLRPIVYERGKAVKERRFDVAKLNREGLLNEESNYCYGEGGAGTFSDGKLYTRSHKRGKIEDILQLFMDHGADEKIGYEAHPHIGTNKLPGIIENLRNTIIERGGVIHFNQKLTDIKIENHTIKGINVNEKFIECSHLILATGHSARDIYYLLHRKNIKIEAKEFAMGFRIEHPQTLINAIQYHQSEYMDLLPPASYSIVEQVNQKGVFSFCMCPGGIIAPAATENNCVVVNGWSPSKRNGQYANSGWVTQIGPDEWKAFAHFGPLAGLKFQESIEQKAHQMGGGSFKVPAQNFSDYIHQRPTRKLNDSSYNPGLMAVDLNQLYPAEINNRLRQGLIQASKKLKGFDHEKAVVTGPESRTSAPVRIPRNEDLQHPEIKGLFPCGEGAGYAGGIISAALDGFRVVTAISRIIGSAHL